MEWILKLAAAGGEGPSLDIMEISKPDDLGDGTVSWLGVCSGNGITLWLIFTWVYV
jgi:hypothetical protein